ncbi:response regulator [Rhizobium sp.]|uniref:response regulator n=1 Tax=Rhizobium sp. TaxID=391 RepID=UPI0028A6F2C0
MDERNVKGCRLLIVEDEYLLADELSRELTHAGAEIVSMVGTCEEALAFLDGEPPIDGAVLDINLGGEYAYPVADCLMDLQVPFLFATGFDATSIPARFEDIPRCEKPIDVFKVVQAIGRS